MDNKVVAKKFKLLSDLTVLHGENPFKSKSYLNAYNNLRRLGDELSAMHRNQLLALPGIGSAIADKIMEFRETGQIAALEKYIALTPPGIVEMLDLKGLGVKKLEAIWKKLGIETAGELLHACTENRLLTLKGFGLKSQAEIEKQLSYFIDSQGKYLYGHIADLADQLLTIGRQLFPNERVELVGDIARQMPECGAIELLTTACEMKVQNTLRSSGNGLEARDGEWYYSNIRCVWQSIEPSLFDATLWQLNASPEFLAAFKEQFSYDFANSKGGDVFAHCGLDFIPCEARESVKAIALAQRKELEFLIEAKDIKGVIHNHSTYSDGIHSLADMAHTARKMGYEYMVMTDHSKAAFYANGLSEAKCLEQFNEIDLLNKTWTDFTLFKGIECDILSDGALDYDDNFLNQFDIVIASIHSNLKMDIDKAHERLLRAIAHPATRILGHMTGRLLLSRQGYPIDHKIVIDACSKYSVAIELNANPYRLDIDWQWIEYATSQNVMIAINPDAHSKKGIEDIRFGVSAARKGLLTRQQCLNTLTVSEFRDWLQSR